MLHASFSLSLQSAFSIRLSKFGFNHYSMFLPDFMHEFELECWKAILTYIIRILHAQGDDTVIKFNAR